MNLTLKNTDFQAEGIFGILTDETGNIVAYTLQHAYDSGNGDGSYAPKVPPGVYKCVRGQHQLAHMTSPFTTFEITGVVGHTNILFHVGNFNRDSEGCVLLGTEILHTKTESMLVNSKLAFQKFMDLQQGIDVFSLTVV